MAPSILWPLLLLSILLLLHHRRRRYISRLPPGPPPLPILGNIPLLWRTLASPAVEPILRRLYSTYGPIITLHLGNRPAIFISSHTIAHDALVHRGALFSDRPEACGPSTFFTSNRHNITFAAYGPLWRVLRRNLTAGVLQPAKLRTFSQGRRRILRDMVERLRCEVGGDGAVMRDLFQDAIFSILVLMCFGERLDAKVVGEIAASQRAMQRFLIDINVFNMLPKLVTLLYRRKWKRYDEIRRRQEDVLLPIIRSRKDSRQRNGGGGGGGDAFVSYLDTLLELELPEEGRRQLDEGEIVSLCSEFLAAGTDTSSSSLEWIMANLVMHQDIQRRLVEEIEGVGRDRVRKEKDGEEEIIGEDDLPKMPYLKAIVLEVLRRHPPSHFVLPHAVSEEGVKLDGYSIPKDATINFAVAEMAWDGKVWKDPGEFRPERFLDGGEGWGVDITGGREIKLMPFGFGRRACPGYGLAMLNLQYLVANFVGLFEWKVVEGEEVDLSERRRFVVVMRNPLRAKISVRGK